MQSANNMRPDKGRHRDPEPRHGERSGASSAGLIEEAAEPVDSPASSQPPPRVRPMPASPLVSQQMSRMPRQDTKPELLLRRELHSRGLRFRCHPSLPGRPDLVFTRAKIAVFVDGCFWHGCSEHGTLPKNNRQWWQAKIDGNIQRDRTKDEALITLGWDVLHVWEHESPIAAADRVEDLWCNKTHRPRGAPE
jgi:DNA mismatch endonuclease, patch repair protein